MSSAADPDSVEAARLRVAHDVLDERPSPAVRAAVLRAATESVGGAAATETVRAPRKRPAGSWFGWRPAAAAGATVAVGILAVGIATHVERETSTGIPIQVPSENAPASVAEPSTPAPTAPSSDKAAPAVSPLPSYNAAPAAPSRADALAPRSKAFAPARDEIGETKPAAAAELADKKARQAAPSEPPPEEARAAIAPPPSQPTEEAKRGVAPQSPSDVAARARLRTMQAPAIEATRREAMPQAAAPRAQPLSKDEAEVQAGGASGPQAGNERLQQAASPQEWLRRIVELRRAGRGVEADEELTRFRAAFPNVKVPDDALR